MTYFDRQYDLLVDNLWSMINSSFMGSNKSNTSQGFLSLTKPDNFPEFVQFFDDQIINNTLPIFAATDVSSLNTSVSNKAIIYNLELTNTNGYIIIGIASNISNAEVSIDSLKNGSDIEGAPLLGFFKQYSWEGLVYEFNFTNVTNGSDYDIYFAAGSDTFATEQLWTKLYHHTRTVGLLKLMWKAASLIGLGILVLFFN